MCKNTAQGLGHLRLNVVATLVSPDLCASLQPWLAVHPQDALAGVMAAMADYGESRSLGANEKPLFVSAAQAAVKVTIVRVLSKVRTREQLPMPTLCCSECRACCICSAAMARAP